MKIVKVLVINTLGLHYEGITSVIYNYVCTMDRSGLEMNFVAFDDIDERLKAKFEMLGTIHYVCRRKKDIKQYMKDLNRILALGFDCVHIHGNSGTMAIESVLAKIHGVQKVILHGHNTTCDHPLLNRFLKILMEFCATERIGCSKAAGNWLYGNRKFLVLNNAIDIERYQFNQKRRELYRREFGFKDEFVIGHSGRFSEQKNHVFLIDVFHAYHSIDDEAKLLLLSDGPLMNSVREKVHQMGLDNYVVFAGRRSDADNIYNAMDFFLLPSLWEGLPLVMLEAQANALPLLASDTITKDAKCTQRAYYFSLNQNANEWAEKISEIRNMEFDRTTDCKTDIRDKGFDIEFEADKLRRMYLS